MQHPHVKGDKKRGAKSASKKESVSTTQKNITQNKLCPECNRIYPGDIGFCSVDGKELVEFTEEDLICPTCKEKASPGEKFCKKDGTQLIHKFSADKKTSVPDKKIEIDLSPDATLEEKTKATMYHVMEGNRLREELNDYEGALEEYKKAEKINPELPSLHFQMGGVYWKLGNQKEALTHLDKCKTLLEAQPPETKSDENYLKTLQEVKVYINKLEKGLKPTEKSQRKELTLAERDERMKKALVENREKWSEMILIPAGKFIMGTT
ncbi:MAG: tetratricopeptide repeat protein, partial [Candidatus Brocadiales bacterium]|nr:tetratricopeptide repeat protein [Candidatus Brocadiales bacterium]